MKSGKHHSDSSFYHPFKELKKLIKKRKRHMRPSREADIPPVTDEMMFLDAMKEVTEIKEFRALPVNTREVELKDCHGKPLDAEAVTALEDIVQGNRPVSLPDTPEYIEWVNHDFRDSVAEKLHAGHYAIQDCLDLHGAVLEDAEIEVESFLKESLRKNLSCIKIIHGRGLRSSNGPVLKDAVVRLLSRRFRKHIVAFVSARQCDGGLGALYVLLR